MTEDNIIEFSRGPRNTGIVKCLICSKSWTGVAPVGKVTGLQCPDCKSDSGAFRMPVYLREGSVLWECKACKNDIFFVQPDRITCIKCGVGEYWPP